MSKRILVVEDQPDSRRIIRDMLAPTDYEVTEAENGEEALAAIAKQRPDLILMDVQLPIMDGYTATRRIKADPALQSIRIMRSFTPVPAHFWFRIGQLKRSRRRDSPLRRSTSSNPIPRSVAPKRCVPRCWPT
jgi:hypothetical protein